MTPEYGVFCPSSPHSVRELLENGSEGLIISGKHCDFRVVLEGMGWQSRCCAADRERLGCL